MQSIPTHSSKAQGQVLGVSGDGGVILGDDGVRFTFTSGDWRDFSAAAASGMRVEFSAAAPYATEVVVLEMPPQYAAPQAGASQPGAAQGYSGQQAYGGSSPDPGFGPVGGQQQAGGGSYGASNPGSGYGSVGGQQQTGGGSYGASSGHQYSVPITPYKDVSKGTVALMCIFLGPIAPALVSFYVGNHDKVCILVGNILFLPVFVVLWPLFVIVGICWLLISDETVDQRVHFMRYHPTKCWSGQEKSDNCLEPRLSRDYIPVCRQRELNRGR